MSDFVAIDFQIKDGRMLEEEDTYVKIRGYCHFICNHGGNSEILKFNCLVSLVFDLIGLVPQCRMKQQKPCESAEAGGGGATTFIEVGWCCVCLSRLKEKDEMRVLPCLHKFHKLCVDRWLKGHHKTCPLCRFSMGAEDKSLCAAEPFTEEMVIWFSSFHIAGI
ncbi:RING finger protein 44 [Senna tora]|uniref:RING-type E3 ubiquitin transferase n=1 Tax=Senna tora TaxID=362788 RepID=A0A834SUW3_9FABA|nr:RING finger protein 44 [Senna tora]